MTRHATDRVDGKIVAQCPNAEHQDDPHLQVQAQYDDAASNGLMETFKDAWDVCGECGAKLDYVAQETPSEVLD